MKNKIITAVFALMLTAFVFVLLFPAGGKNAGSENRELSSMPSLTRETFFSGEFSQKFESFIDDNIAFRPFFLSLGEKLSADKGIDTPAGRLVYADRDIGTDETKKTSFLIVGDRVFEMFMKDRALEDKYIAAINHYARRLSSDITLFAAIIPTSLEFEEPLYANTEDSQKEAIDYIYANLDERVKTIDMYSSLQTHSGEYIYFRTDHHWTQLGAYYGCAAFSAAVGNTPVSLAAFEQKKFTDFLGSLYTQTSAVELADKPDTIEWYDTAANSDFEISMRRYENGVSKPYKSPIFNEEYPNYRFFLSGDNPFVELTNKNNPGGKTIIILRDSFANAFAPWIIHNYKKVVLIDPRTCRADFNEILEEFRPDEVLIMNYIFSTAFRDYSDLLTGLYAAP